jgi:hypothetical protein
MTKKDRETISIQNARLDDLDRALDAALAKYAVVEPRVALEERILAHLHAETATSASHAWWRWGFAAVAAVLLLAVGMVWRWGKSTPPVITHRPLPALQGTESEKSEAENQDSATQFAVNRQNQVSPQPTPSLQETVGSKRPRSGSVAVTEAEPKLDQFPSPRPLTEQERMALDYVERFPREAAEIARAQNALVEQEQKERAEKYGPMPGPAGTQIQQIDSPNL